MNETQTYPFNDETMTYDFTEHFYVLTPDYVRKELGLDVVPTVDAGQTENEQLANAQGRRMLKNVSRFVYNWIYSQSGSNAWQEAVMALVPDMRSEVRNMLLAQLEYVINNGDLSNLSGVDPIKGQWIDRKIMTAAAIAPQAEAIANKIQPCLGYSLLYAGFHSIPNCAYRQGY